MRDFQTPQAVAPQKPPPPPTPAAPSGAEIRRQKYISLGLVLETSDDAKCVNE
jgi:hypothetical protein